MRTRRQAFTFVELLVTLAIACMLIALSASVACKAKEYAFRLKCGSNLRTTFDAMLRYSLANGNKYPRTTHVAGAPPTQFTGVNANDPFAAGGPAANDVSAALFLLVRTQGLPPEALVCPTTSALLLWNFGGGSAQSVSNFPSGLHLGYSVANPYPDSAAVAAGYVWSNRLGAEFALLADTNPGDAALAALTPDSPAADMRQGNSRNEMNRGGQMVLFGDGHAEFCANPFCGTRRDNIYTVSGSADGRITTSSVIVGSPAWSGDSVLLPVATVDPKGLEAPWDREARIRWQQQRTAWMLAGAAALLAACGYVYRRRRHRRRRSAAH